MSRSQIFWIKLMIAIATCGLVITTISTFVTGFEYYQSKANEIQETSCTADSCTVGLDVCSMDGRFYYECYEVKINFHSGIYTSSYGTIEDYESNANDRCSKYYPGYNFTCYYQQDDITNTLSLNKDSYYSEPSVLLIFLIIADIGFGIFLICTIIRYQKIRGNSSTRIEFLTNDNSKTQPNFTIPQTTTAFIV